MGRKPKEHEPKIHQSITMKRETRNLLLAKSVELSKTISDLIEEAVSGVYGAFPIHLTELPDYCQGCSFLGAGECKHCHFYEGIEWGDGEYERTADDD